MLGEGGREGGWYTKTAWGAVLPLHVFNIYLIDTAMDIVLRLLRDPVQHFPCRGSSVPTPNTKHHGYFQTHSDAVLGNWVWGLYSDQRQVTNVGTDDLFLQRNLPWHMWVGRRNGRSSFWILFCFCFLPINIFEGVCSNHLWHFLVNHLVVPFKVLKYFCINLMINALLSFLD